jgi:hypothetical protein
LSHLYKHKSIRNGGTNTGIIQLSSCRHLRHRQSFKPRLIRKYSHLKRRNENAQRHRLSCSVLCTG